MTTLTQPYSDQRSAGESIADLLHRLGDIPAQRVRLHPYPGTATMQDVIEIEAHEKRLFELVDGVLVEKAMGYWESWLAMRIATTLQAWLTSKNLPGFVTGETGMMRILPAQVRMPDVAYTTPERFPGGIPTADPVPEISPNLAVEVISDSNTKSEIERKRAEYFKSGTQLVWEVDPHARTVTVFTEAEEFEILNQDQVLDGKEVLPGFTLALKDLFSGLPLDLK